MIQIVIIDILFNWFISYSRWRLTFLQLLNNGNKLFEMKREINLDVPLVPFSFYDTRRYCAGSKTRRKRNSD